MLLLPSPPAPQVSQVSHEPPYQLDINCNLTPHPLLFRKSALTQTSEAGESESLNVWKWEMRAVEEDAWADERRRWRWQGETFYSSDGLSLPFLLTSVFPQKTSADVAGKQDLENWVMLLLMQHICNTTCMSRAKCKKEGKCLRWCVRSSDQTPRKSRLSFKFDKYKFEKFDKYFISREFAITHILVSYL